MPDRTSQPCDCGRLELDKISFGIFTHDPHLGAEGLHAKRWFSAQPADSREQGVENRRLAGASKGPLDLECKQPPPRLKIGRLIEQVLELRLTQQPFKDNLLGQICNALIAPELSVVVDGGRVPARNRSCQLEHEFPDPRTNLDRVILSTEI